MEKAFDTVPSELAMRWTEVGEADVKIVEAMYRDNSGSESRRRNIGRKKHLLWKKDSNGKVSRVRYLSL